jgi:hypothetical protein
MSGEDTSKEKYDESRIKNTSKSILIYQQSKSDAK